MSRPWGSLLLGPLLLTGCFGLSTEDEQRIVVHQQNSKSYYDSGDMNRAEQQARLGLELDDDDENLQLTLAYILLRRGDRNGLLEAEGLLKGLQGWWTSDDYRVIMGRGIIHQRMAYLESADDGDTEVVRHHRKRARSFLEQSLELEPESVEAGYQLSILDYSEDRIEKFFRDSERTIELLESSILIKNKILERTKDAPSRSAIVRDRNTDARRVQALLRYRAEVFQRDGRTQDAVADMDRLEDSQSLSRIDHYNRATMLVSMGDLDRAVSDFDQFIKLSPSVDSEVEHAIEQLQFLRAKLAERRVATEIESRGGSRR